MNFRQLAEKLKRIEEGDDLMAEPMPAAPAPTDSSEPSLGGAGASDESVAQECGMPMPPMMGGMPMNPPQQDSVSMNVNMNAQGKGGIRDLMDVLKNIEQATPGGNIDGVMNSQPHHAEIDADPELDIAMPQQSADDMGDGDDAVMVIDKEEDEAYSNEPNPEYQDNDYMQHDLAGGADKPQKMTKGGYRNADNALTMAAILPVAAAMGRMGEGLQESLKGQLQAHYNSIKEAYNPNSASAEHRRNLDKSEHDRLKAAAEKEGASESDKARYQRYKDRKAATAAAYDREMER